MSHNRMTARILGAAGIAVATGTALLAGGTTAVAHAEPPGMCAPGMPCGPGGGGMGMGGPGGFDRGGPGEFGPTGFGGPGGPGGPGANGPGGPGGPILGPVGNILSDLCVLPIVCPPR